MLAAGRAKVLEKGADQPRLRMRVLDERDNALAYHRPDRDAWNLVDSRDISK